MRTVRIAAARRHLLPLLLALLYAPLWTAPPAQAQSIALPWSSYGHDPQHSGQSLVASQSLGRIRWSMPIDLNPQISGDDLLIHYGSPLITAQNTVIVPIKTGASDGFQVEGHSGIDGSLLWTQTTDYHLPPHNWTPSFGMALTPKNQVCLPGAGGTVIYRSNADSPTSATGAWVFYGQSNFDAAPDTYRANVTICTPITSDRYGDIFFGFLVTGSTPLGLQSGIARISYTGVGTYVSVTDASGDINMDHVAYNAAPALSNDQKTLYIPIRATNGAGYLVALRSSTLQRTGRVVLLDAQNTSSTALISDDGTASPTVGPDGDVYYGVLESPLGSHNFRGWLLHFSADLTQTKTPGSFGWDDTTSIVPSSAVPSYTGSSPYLLMTKYNNYAGAGGDGVNKLAILDPFASQTDTITGGPNPVMKEILTVTGPTPDPEQTGSHPNAVKEWCINAAAVDPIRKSVLVGSEDGNLYRWDLTTNTLVEALTLTPGIGEAYTPTLIGIDGTVYTINYSTLFAVGN